MPSNIELSIVIPALNESGIILENVDEVSIWIQKNMPSLTYEVLVVDDGSTDGMAELIQDAKATRTWLNVVSHSTNRGRGKGVRTGFENTTGKYIICLDADLSYSPDHIKPLLEPLLSDLADVTLASPYHADGKVIDVPWQRAVLSKWGNRILGFGFGGSLKTVTCIVRGYTREAVENLELVSDGKELHLEVIQKILLLGFRVLEVPATLFWRDKKRGKSPKKSIMPEIAIFKMRRTVLSHLIFNFITNPGMLLFIPMMVMLGLISVGAVSIFKVFIEKLIELPQEPLLSVLRQVLINGELTLIIMLFSMMLLMVFVAFYFISFQNKRYFEESYTLLMRMNKKMKQLEKENKD